jgi:hypothetical protein
MDWLAHVSTNGSKQSTPIISVAISSHIGHRSLRLCLRRFSKWIASGPIQTWRKFGRRMCHLEQLDPNTSHRWSVTHRSISPFRRTRARERFASTRWRCLRDCRGFGFRYGWVGESMPYGGCWIPGNSFGLSRQGCRVVQVIYLYSPVLAISGIVFGN